jgi:hypothetical protein
MKLRAIEKRKSCQYTELKYSILLLIAAFNAFSS